MGGCGINRSQLNYMKASHEVRVRFSIASENTLPDDNKRGGEIQFTVSMRPKNIGLSIVREGRELELDPAMGTKFKSQLSVGGVRKLNFHQLLMRSLGSPTISQNATKLAQMAKFDWEDEAETNESKGEFIQRLQDEGDPKSDSPSDNRFHKK